jgi:SAM-dependent methyltransferase
MSGYSPRKYWANLAENYGNCDQMGFSPVLHPGAPAWFNRCIDGLQERAWLRALALCKLRASAFVLDVGCGTGRWVRRYSDLGYSPIGTDGSPSMLLRALELKTVTPLAAAQLQSLPFRDEVFDCVSAITVIQHIPESEQPAAIKEMVRVIRRGGCVVLLEVIRDRAAHVFPHKPLEWVARMRACGLELIDWFGEEFLILDRVITTAVSLGRRILPQSEKNGLPVPSETPKADSNLGGFAKRMYWQARRVSMSLSPWMEPLASRVCRPDWATHAAFVFRKPSERS